MRPALHWYINPRVQYYGNLGEIQAVKIYTVTFWAATPCLVTDIWKESTVFISEQKRRVSSKHRNLPNTTGYYSPKAHSLNNFQFNPKLLFIHCEACLATSPQPLPEQADGRVLSYPEYSGILECYAV